MLFVCLVVVVFVSDLFCVLPPCFEGDARTVERSENSRIGEGVLR